MGWKATTGMREGLATAYRDLLNSKQVADTGLQNVALHNKS